MAKDERDLLTVLRNELEFLEKGGYRYTARVEWRPHFMFQDSPTCLNFDPTLEPKPCRDCVLVQLVPEDSRNKRVACRFIPLNEQGETVDSIYRYGTQEDLEATVARWLKATIRRLESERGPAQTPDSMPDTVHVKGRVTWAA